MAPTPSPLPLTVAKARALWLRAQRLGASFGSGTSAVRSAVEHLGYVQIDTINVIERAHHHILWSRIPDYRRADLAAALGADKSVFEYWAHALAYIPVRDYRFYLADMRRRQASPAQWFAAVSPADLRRLLARIRRDGPLTIRDFGDETRVDKDHPWASRNPAKRVLECAFFAGLLTVSARAGMVKTYELTDRHFGWERRPRVATEAQTLEYLLDRALRAQGVVSLDSICHLDAPRKPALAALIEARVGRRKLVRLAIEGAERPHWAAPETIATAPEPPAGDAHILSPFDPLVIQRKRLNLFFGYDHRFEAYVPKEKRVYGYFTLPVLVGDRIAAAVDIKTDRAARTLLIQQWTWVDRADGDQGRIDEALGRFERFQLGE